MVKKLLILLAVAGAGYLVYRQVMASREENDLWSEATTAPDLSASYEKVQDEPSTVDDVVSD